MSVNHDEAMKTFVQVLFAMDTITIHKRKGQWTVKVHDGGKWIESVSPNLFVATFAVAQKVILKNVQN